MGVLNKLKSRMRGPAKSYEGYDTMGFSSGKGRASGVDYVTQALEVAANQPVIQDNTAEKITDAFDSMSSSISGLTIEKGDRKKELDDLQKSNKDMTRGEARKKRRKTKKLDRANKRYEKSLPKGKELEEGITNITDKGYDTLETCKAKGGTLGFMGRDEATGKGFGKCSV